MKLPFHRPFHINKAQTHRRVSDKQAGRGGLFRVHQQRQPQDAADQSEVQVDFEPGFDHSNESTTMRSDSRTNLATRESTAGAWSRCRPILAKTLQIGRKGCCMNTLDQPFPRTFEVLLVSFTDAKRITLNTCGCIFGHAATLLDMGYFPTAPTNPSVAIAVDVLSLFHDVLCEGSISKHAFSSGLRIYLERKTKTILPLLVKHFYTAYAQWQATVDDANTAFLSELSSASNLDWSISACSNNCPACFYRTPDEFSQPLICAVDGVFSHRRLKGGKGHEVEFEQLPTFLFDKPGQRLNEEDDYVEPQANCGHTFRAAEKPKTLLKFDETGLMGLTCRHGQGIRYIDLYEGERYKYAYRLFKLVQQENPLFSNFGLMYDIGCRFDPYLKNRDIEFWKQSHIAVNAFHVHGHPLSCQITRSPRRMPGFGWSDGEHSERDWSSKRHLVAGGQVSSSARRRQILDAQSRRRNAKLIVELPIVLTKRLRAAHTRGTRAHEELLSLFRTTLTVNQHDGSSTIIPWSFEFLDRQIDSQKQFFEKSRDRAKDKATNLKIFTALKKERDLEKKLNAEYEKCDGDRNKAMSQKTWVETGATRLYPERIAATDKLLAAAEQTRADWNPDGTLWKSFTKSNNPAFKVYLSVERERKIAKSITQFIENNAAESFPAGSSGAKWLNQQRIDLERLQLATSEQIRKYNFQYEDHVLGSANWTRFKTEEIKEELEVILHDLMVLSATRTAELKALHSRVSGQKEARPLMISLYKRYPAIESLVKKFNNTASELPHPNRVAVLSTAAFMPRIDPDTGDPLEASEEALWNVEFIQAHSAVRSNGPVVDPADDHTIWGQHSIVRKAIDLRLRQLKALEEISLVLAEGTRLWRWTVDRAQSAIDFSQKRQFVPQLREFMWEQLYLIRNWLSSDIDLFSPMQRSKALGIL
jgi:hypothetical protein